MQLLERPSKLKGKKNLTALEYQIAMEFIYATLKGLTLVKKIETLKHDQTTMKHGHTNLMVCSHV